MTRTRIIIALLILWTALWMASWTIPALQPATGDGFTRGMNRVASFFLLQIGAGLVALVLLALLPSTGRLRWLAMTPAAMAALLVVAVVAIILWARLNKPDPQPTLPPKPTTEAAPALPAPAN